ncbi:DUF2716 domain-containing protein [Streptomyces sp. NPDC050504]|uniref:DUF2716 domain-containing protein n=1 Tax=Streptomyces sp. NPDC050504 TaxID=3365618 RepID=UPI0037B41877
MTDAPVIAMPAAEERRHWNRFQEQFNFRPGSGSTAGAGIKEPADSVTWSLTSMFEAADADRVDRFIDVVERGLTSCTKPDHWLIALEWQHPSYWFLPHRVGGEGRPPWPLVPIPDGDYYIILSEDFDSGGFGHPWEETICLFGQDLVESVTDEIDALLGPPIRSSGLPV